MKNVKILLFYYNLFVLGGHPNRLFCLISISYENILSIKNFNISLRFTHCHITEYAYICNTNKQDY